MPRRSKPSRRAWTATIGTTTAETTTSTAVSGRTTATDTRDEGVPATTESPGMPGFDAGLAVVALASAALLTRRD